MPDRNRPHYFITNEKGYFFEVMEEIDLKKLTKCTIHDSLTAMYQHVCKEGNLHIDEVECGEMRIKGGQCFDDRGCGSHIEETIEAFINNFVL